MFWPDPYEAPARQEAKEIRLASGSRQPGGGAHGAFISPRRRGRLLDQRQQPIEHAPDEGAVRAASLQRGFDVSDPARTHASIRLRRLIEFRHSPPSQRPE